MADEPIEPQDYLHGVKVVDIGDVRVARGMTRRYSHNCRHFQMVYDHQERRVWCSECKTDVDPFDAFEIIVNFFHTEKSRLESKQSQLDEAMKHNVRSRAAKALDKIWMGRRMVPACPCCGEGLLAEDFADGIRSSLGLDYATARRAKLKKDRK